MTNPNRPDPDRITRVLSIVMIIWMLCVFTYAILKIGGTL